MDKDWVCLLAVDDRPPSFPPPSEISYKLNRHGFVCTYTNLEYFVFKINHFVSIFVQVTRGLKAITYSRSILTAALTLGQVHVSSEEKKES